MTADENNAPPKHDLTQEIVECRRHGYILSGKFLGQGAYAKVYLGHATQETISNNPRIKNATMDSTSCKVAIKIISSESAPKVYISKFLPREISTMNKCYKHKNVIRLYDMFATMKRVYLVLEYATSGDLLTYINQCCVKNPCYSVTEAVAKVIFRDIVLGLYFIHHKGVAHRDLKCENILLSNGVNVKLTDFGFAVDTENKKELLKTHCGSYAYAPPEILKQQNYDGKLADLWSLGVILFAMVNGGLPFKESSAKAVLAAMKKPVYFKSHLSADCKSIIRSLLKIKPQRRLSISEIFCHPWICSITDASMIKDYGKEQILTSIQIKGTGDKNRVSEPAKVLHYLQEKMSPCSGLKQETRYLGFTKPKVSKTKKICSPKLTSKTMLHGKIIPSKNLWKGAVTTGKDHAKPSKEECGDVTVNNYKQPKVNETKIYNSPITTDHEQKTCSVQPSKKEKTNTSSQNETNPDSHAFKKSTSPNVINLKIDHKSTIKCGVFSDIFKYQNLNAFPMNLYSLPYQQDMASSQEKQKTSGNKSPVKSESKDTKGCTIQQLDIPQTKEIKVEPDQSPKIKAKSVSPSHRTFKSAKSSSKSKTYKNMFANHISDTTPKPLKQNEDQRICKSAFKSLDTVQYHLTCSHAKRRNAILKSKGLETKKIDEIKEVEDQPPVTNYNNQNSKYQEKFVYSNQSRSNQLSPNQKQFCSKPTAQNITSYKYNYAYKTLDQAKVQHILDFSMQKQLHNANYLEGDNNGYTEIVTLAVPQNSKQRFTKNHVPKLRNRSAIKQDIQNKLVLPKCKQAFIPLPSCGTWHNTQNIQNNFESRPSDKSTNKQKIVLKLKNR